MKFLSWFFKKFYVNNLIYLGYKTISYKNALKKLNNKKYIFLYISKNEKDLPNKEFNNCLIVNHLYFDQFKLFLNKKQKIIILSNQYESTNLFRLLIHDGYKVYFLKVKKNKTAIKINVDIKIGQ